MKLHCAQVIHTIDCVMNFFIRKTRKLQNIDLSARHNVIFCELFACHKNIRHVCIMLDFGFPKPKFNNFTSVTVI